MTLKSTQARDKIVRDTLVGYGRGDLSETEMRERLRKCGWPHASIEKMVEAVKNNLIPGVKMERPQ